MKKWYMRILVIGLLMSVFLLGGLTLSPVLASPLVAEFNCAGQSSIPVDQCKALVAIYEATGGENWRGSVNTYLIHALYPRVRPGKARGVQFG